MTRTLGSSTRALARQRIVALASMLALAACGDERPVDSTTKLESFAFEEPSDDTSVEPTDTPAPDASKYTQYIAFGDSFTSGFGLAGTVGLASKGNSCARNFSAAWPPLVNEKLGIANPLIFAACSAATTRDILTNGPLVPNIQPRPQIQELPPPQHLDTALITIQIGGNDIKYDESFAKCAKAVQDLQSKASFSCVGVALSALAPECRDLDWLINNTTQVVTGNLVTTLEETFRAVRDAAPHATIVAVGYPHLVDATSACDNTLIGWCFDGDTRLRLNGVADAINASIAKAAANAGILSVTKELVDAFAGHEACSSDEWIDTLSIHPNVVGHEVYAEVVVNGVPAAPTRTAVTNQGPEPTIDPVPPAEDVGDPRNGETDTAWQDPPPEADPAAQAPADDATPEDRAEAEPPPPEDEQDEPQSDGE